MPLLTLTFLVARSPLRGQDRLSSLPLAAVPSVGVEMPAQFAATAAAAPGGQRKPETTPAVPSFVVTTTSDDTNGAPGNCTNQNLPGAERDPSCSLRDALAASEPAGGAITFDATVFVPYSDTIALGSAGVLVVPSNTAIHGLTSGTGASLGNLVTVVWTVADAFEVDAGTMNASISNLTIEGGGPGNFAALENAGSVTITDCAIEFNQGERGAIYNASGASLTLLNSAVTGNGGLEGPDVNGNGNVQNDGTMTVTNSTFFGNISFNPNGGGAILNNGTLTVSSSTFSGDTIFYGHGPEISNLGTMTVENSLLASFAGSPSLSLCYGTGCPVNGTNGNSITGALTTIGSYGGPTSTMLPPPGNGAICGGLPSSLTTDQRGLPRTTTYGSTKCVDSGAAQTNYSLIVTMQPPATVAAGSEFQVNFQVNESGAPVSLNGRFVISLALGAGDPGTLNPTSVVTNSGGAYVLLYVQAPGTNDTIIASLPLTTNPPAPVISTTTQPFDVTSATVEVTMAAYPSGPKFSVDGTSYTGPITLAWAVGSQHSIATSSPQGDSCKTFRFTQWSDGGAISHKVFASTETTSYTAYFNTAASPADGCVLTTSASPAQDGTVSPRSGSYAYGTVVDLTATPAQGDVFSGWSGNVASPLSASTTITMSGSESVTANFFRIPTNKNFVVNTSLDDAVGAPGNCTTAGAACSLRDALQAALLAGSGVITFDPAVFSPGSSAAARTITLTYGTLNIGSNTTINGPVTGSGASLTQLVTVSGDPSYQGTVFDIDVTVKNAAIYGLIITNGGDFNYGGGGIVNFGELTVSSCLVLGNFTTLLGGAGIYNDGSLTLLNSTLTGNTIFDTDLFNPGGGGLLNDDAGTAIVTGTNILGNSSAANSYGGGGISNVGKMTLTASTVSGNSIPYDNPLDSTPAGAGIENYGTLTVADTTIDGNDNSSAAGGGGGLDNEGTMTMVNSDVSGNDVDVSGSFSPYFSQGNGGGISNEGSLTITSSDITANQAPEVGNGSGIYTTGKLAVTNSIVADNTINNTANPGTPTYAEDDCDGTGCPVNRTAGDVVGAGKSSLLPGSPALCAGLLADIPPGLSTDQRGQPRTTAYGSTTCVDSGAIETHYSLAFSTQPPATVSANKNFTAAVQLDESGSPFAASGIAIPLALGPGDKGALNVSSLSTNGNGIASSSSLEVTAAGSGDTLVATLPITATPPPAPIGKPIDIGAASRSFDVTGTSGFAIRVIRQDPAVESYNGGVIAGFLLQLTSTGGFDGEVTLSCSGGPPASTCGELPAMVKVNGTATALGGVWYPKTTAPGTYSVTFLGISGSVNSSTTATFTVK
jgi:CSLREA domain-containing protein